MNNMILIFAIIALIVLFIIIQNNWVEHLTDGGALIQLNAKGPMDDYLISNAGDYWPNYYDMRPKRMYRFYPYFNTPYLQ